MIIFSLTPCITKQIIYIVFSYVFNSYSNKSLILDIDVEKL